MTHAGIDGGWRMAAAALVLAAVSLLASAVLFQRVQTSIGDVEAERLERTDQSCAINERKQADDIRSLTVTYEYVQGLTPRQRREPINALIIRELPRAARDAREDDAAPFCDEPGVGLPEPGPRVPKRPDGLMP